MSRALEAWASRVALAAAAGALALLSATGVLPAGEATTLPRVAEEAAGLARGASELRERQLYFESRAFESRARRTEGPGSEAARPLGRLGGRSVFLFIVESYGYTLYSEPSHLDLVAADIDGLQAALDKGGYAVVSTFLTSPAFGGNSWLADSTLTTGLRVDNQAAYDLLVASDARPMADYFNEAGYRTVAAMPAVTGPYPEGGFFRFQRSYAFADFGYRGPSLRWAPMTDQFAIDLIHRKEVAVAERPLFVQYVLVSSHYPFNLIPRYFDDWSQIGDGSVYAAPGSVAVVPAQPGSNTGGAQGYAAAIRYDLRVITDYVTRILEPDDDSLILVVGDHQPYSGITGKGKPWSVPIHALSRDHGVLEPFRKRGYTPGWVPRQPPPHRGMEDFLPGFLEDFGGDGSGGGGGGDGSGGGARRPNAGAAAR
jgi:hypothetical protein